MNCGYEVYFLYENSCVENEIENMYRYVVLHQHLKTFVIYK